MTTLSSKRRRPAHRLPWEEILAQLLLWPSVSIDYLRMQYDADIDATLERLQERVPAVFVTRGRARLDRRMFACQLASGGGVPSRRLVTSRNLERWAFHRFDGGAAIGNAGARQSSAPQE